MARYRGRPGEHGLPVGRKSGDLFDGAYDLRHLVHMPAGDEHRKRCEQVRTALGNELAQSAGERVGIERPREGLGVQADAKAVGVQRLDHGFTSSGRDMSGLGTSPAPEQQFSVR